MNEEKRTIQSWLTAAVSGIRFKPDRAEVERELRDHLEDKVADLRRIFPDMDGKEAETMALERMGDPEEIGKELARIHRPWLGWLWRGSQAILGIMVYISLLIGLSALTQGAGIWFEPGRGLAEYLMAPENSVVKLEPSPERVKVDGYTISMVDAGFIKDGDRLGVVLRTISPYFWDRGCDSITEYLRAVDSAGYEYVSHSERFSGNFSCKSVGGSPVAWGPFHRDYLVWVEDIDEREDWVRLEYDWLGRSFEMTVGLKEAEA